MLINILRAVGGYVEFEVSGGFAERFINLCTLDRILLWNIKNDSGKVKAFTTEDGFSRMERAVKNSGMQISMQKKRGIPQFIKAHKARCGVVLGILLCLAFVWFMSSFIWSVGVTGNTTVKSDALTESAAEYGVKIGALKRNIDAEDIARRLLFDYERLSWAAVNIFGSKAVIEVREATLPPETDKGSGPANVVAAKAGQIVLIEGYSGTNTVKENEAVAEGDLLISAVIKNSDGTESLTRASGRIFAKTVNAETESFPLSFSAQYVSRCDIRRSLYLFGFDLPFGAKCTGGIFGSGTERIKGGGEFLPIGCSWQVFLQTARRDITLEPDLAALCALRKCVYDKRTSLSSAEIEKIAFAVKYTQGAVTVGYKSDCTENIAKSSPVGTE